jgi:hypothetical protein
VRPHIQRIYGNFLRTGREAKGLRVSRGLTPLLSITLWSAWGHLYLCVIDHMQRFNRHSCSALWDSMALQIETRVSESMCVCLYVCTLDVFMFET